jgi:hypothetical protein
MLEKEVKFYEANQSAWQAEHRGEFVVVRGEVVLGFFPSEDEALSAGATAYGLSPFLVRKLGKPPKDLSAPALTLGIFHAHP